LRVLKSDPIAYSRLTVICKKKRKQSPFVTKRKLFRETNVQKILYLGCKKEGREGGRG